LAARITRTESLVRVDARLELLSAGKVIGGESAFRAIARLELGSRVGSEGAEQ